MAIRFSKYIDINSSVQGASGVIGRNFMERLFDTNPLIPSGASLDFDTATDVSTYFGSSSKEYARALFYFSRPSKLGTFPTAISFARWVDEAQAPQIYGARLTQTLAQLKTITTGAFSLTLGVDTHVLTGIDFSAATTLADIAAALQTAIRTQTGTMWTAATVTYNSLRGSFDLVGGSAIAAAVSVQAPGSGTDITFDIGWLPNDPCIGAIWSNGSLAESITDTLTNSVAVSDNFGSFDFVDSLSDDEKVEAAEWNQAQNVKYIYLPSVSAGESSALSALIRDIEGVGLTLSPLSDEYPEMLPANIFASTDYSQPGSAQNYMFQVAALTPSVSTTALSDFYDDLNINYYGRTQNAGNNIDFYQRGVLMGLPSAPTDINTYANEIWLKDAIGVVIMNALLISTEIPANQKGRSQLLALISTVAQQAVINGTISVGKLLNDDQKAAITGITGDNQAWLQVQNIGYWLDVQIVLISGQYVARYKLVYSKNDVIRKVIGDDILI